MKKVTIAELDKALAIEKRLNNASSMKYVTKLEITFVESVEARYRKLSYLRPQKSK